MKAPDMKISYLFKIALLKAATISALSLQLSQPIVPAVSDSAINLPSPNGYVSAGQTDGTIALPPNGPDKSFPYLSNNDSSQASNGVYISALNVSTLSGLPNPLLLPPLPGGWRVLCDDIHGTDMNYSSCREAWTYFPVSDKQVRYRSRKTASRVDIGLPRRYISSTLRHFCCHSNSGWTKL